MRVAVGTTLEDTNGILLAPATAERVRDLAC